MKLDITVWPLETKSSVMNKVFGDGYSNIDASLPKEYWGNPDVFWLVMDFRTNVFGKLVDMRELHNIHVVGDSNDTPSRWVSVLSNDGHGEGHGYNEFFIEGAWRHEDWFGNYLDATGFKLVGIKEGLASVVPKDYDGQEFIFEDNDLPF